MIVFVWLSDLTNRLVEAHIGPRGFSSAILEALAEVSDAILEFQTEVNRGPPVIVKHMMHYMADVMCVFTPAILQPYFTRMNLLGRRISGHGLALCLCHSFIKALSG